MKVAVLDKKGKSTGREVSLPEDLFGVEPNEHVMYLAVKSHLAAKRQGTSKSKTRNEITGSTRKIKKQKGTGTARAGSIKSPIFKGGGTVFGPQPRNYVLKLNKKEKQLARASALSAKAKDESLKVVEDISFDQPKTKDFKSLLDSIQANGKILYVHNEESISSNVIKSARNISKLETVNVTDVNTYQILHADHLVFSEGALTKMVDKK